MKKKALAALLMFALICTSVAMTACQRNVTETVPLVSSSNSSSESTSAKPASSEIDATSSAPALSVNSEGQVVDSSGNAVSGYEVSSKGEIVSSATGDVVVSASSEKAPSSTVPATSSNPPASSKAPASSTHTHSYTATVVKPTCTAQGYTNHKCSCGHSYQDTVTAALGHSFGSWVVTKSATTTSEGTETRTCSRCKTTENRAIAKLAGKYDAVATSSNAKLVAERTLFYINEYRKSEGKSTATPLPNMTAYAEYRSRQLVTNFAHDADDEHAAATALKYGEYSEMQESYFDAKTGTVVYTGNVIKGYSPGCGEAIGNIKNVEGGSIDYIAKNMASSIRGSAGHWAYVGNTVNIYISVGFTCSNGNWYCDICTSNTNQYG